MFEASGDPGEVSFCVPGVPRPAVPASPPAELLALRAAVDAVLAVDLHRLGPGEALELTRALLVEQQRLQAATLGSVAELDARQLYALDGAGSTRSWLAQQPVARTGLAAEATRLVARPLLRAAVAAGQVSAATADVVASLLARLPGQVEEHQIVGVLQHALPALLVDRGVPAEELAAAAGVGVGSIADRLEPACVLLARHLPPTTLAFELRSLVDALLPERLADDTRQSWRDASLTLQQRTGAGWTLRGHLDDQTGQLLHDALHARLPKPSVGPVDLPGDSTPAGADAPTDPADADAPTDPADWGAVGPGRPTPLADRWADPAVQGAPCLSRGQRLVSALATLLADLTGIAPGSGRPQPVALTVAATLDALHGTPGALPAQQDSPRPVSLSLDALRRLGCGATLSAVLLDAAGNPVGASGEHRHATQRERRALRARWGSRCAINGCAQPGPIPHHVPPWWKTHRTALEDLIPTCEHHHHDVHDGHHTLRLRDGRLINDQGWADQLPLAD
jgi:hypothetical protein